MSRTQPIRMTIERCLCGRRLRSPALLAALSAAVLVGAPAAAEESRPENPHGPLDVECSVCHSPEGWKPARISRDFDHNQYFQLEGAHKQTECMACHQTLVFKKTETDCAACHEDVHRSEMGADCSRCHTTRSFIDDAEMRRLHLSTRFPLTGAHATVNCESCHATGPASGHMEFVQRDTECVSCHAEDFRATVEPDHEALGFSTDCAGCHATTGWALTGDLGGGNFDHNLTRFPLTGAHRSLNCSDCHRGNTFKGLNIDCVSCHRDDFQATTNPDHRGSGFSTDCQICHSTTSWQGANFDHNQTNFPLTGAHRNAACLDCHGDGVYTGKPTDCYSCHQQDFEATTNPVHSTSGFGTGCEICHDTNSWMGATFDHNKTNFPLTGAHKTVDCTVCHADGVYAGKPTDCFSCHSQDYNGTTNPPHAASSFPTTCETCHDTNTWLGATFDHNQTNFPLTGAHRNVDCMVCHGDGVYTGKPTDCYSCHKQDYDSTTNPVHSTSGFGTDCEICHDTNSWLGATFDHNKTNFPLTGAHRALDCSACHADGVYAGKPTDCYSCHSQDYNGTTDPPHAASGFPTTCETCHDTNTWLGATFDHNQTNFPLTGAHRNAACSDCHGDGVYKGKPTDCYSCHKSDYDNSTNPNHMAAHFPTDCEQCHNTTTWQGAQFDHDGMYFPIYSGKHKGKWGGDCSTCHINPNNYAEFECILCHKHAQDKTDPKHRNVSGYRYDSRACYSCHPQGRK